MLISTTNTLEGYEIRSYLGIVSGETIVGINLFKDMFAAVRDIVGGRAAAYERELEKARAIALGEMERRADEMGADAVIAVSLDYETIGNKGSMMMVGALGTAVRLRRISASSYDDQTPRKENVWK